MFVDARTLDDGAVIDCDLCIMGAGAAGITLAMQFAGGPLRVVVIESGGLDFDDDTHALLGADSVGHPYPALEMSRLRYLGGTTNHWGGHCVPLRPIDLEKRDWIPDSGWPVGWEELERYYRRAHRVLWIGDCDYDPDSVAAQANLPLLPIDSRDGVETVVSRYHAVRFGEVYREALRRAPNVAVHLWANAVEVVRSAESRRVTAVRTRTLDGRAHTVRAARFVLALGGIENARLLLASRSVEPHGLGNAHDLVGRYFLEHIWLPVGLVVPDDRDAVYSLYVDEQEQPAGYRFRAHLALGAVAQRRLRVAGFRAELGLIEVPNAVNSAEAIVTFDWEGELRDHLRRTVEDADEVIGYLMGTIGFGGYYLRNYFEPMPNRDSRVVLSDRRDPLGQPRATVDWRLSPADFETLRTAHAVIATSLQRAGFGALRSPLLTDPSGRLDHATGGCHHCGTTRMSDDPRRGVVDADGRVHGLDNLYCAGSSVFPTVGYANPTLTIVALAIRLADHLKRQAL
ncbi:MAG: GMC oxidoreductase [Rhodospirillales bacterium]